MSRVTWMRGSQEWWLSKQRKDGREVYPKRILVGRLDRPRKYIPCLWKMEDEEFAVALEGLSAVGDTESSHFNADCMLSAFLRSVGYSKTADAYDSLDKWYS